MACFVTVRDQLRYESIIIIFYTDVVFIHFSVSGNINYH